MKSLLSGKVREVYEAGEDNLIILTTDRISAFDVIMPTPIPNKGIVLNKISEFWFDFTKDIVPNHVVSTNVGDYPSEFQNPDWQGRSMMVRKLNMVPIECIVRGYLVEGKQKLPEPIFCPSTKAELGKHDEYISIDEAKKIAGEDTIEKIKDVSIEIFKKCSDYAFSRGIIIADTKFEFGIDASGEIAVGDEMLTPDSSRFWTMDGLNFDKQYLRDWLTEQGLAGVTPAPELPQEVCDKTAEKYMEAYKAIVGEDM